MISFLWLALGILGLFALGSLAKRLSKDAANNKLGYQLYYQPMSLAFALLLWLLNRITSSADRDYLSLGDLSARSTMLTWLGFDETAKWTEIGITFALIPLLVTCVVVYFQVLKSKTWTIRNLGFAILLAVPLSVTNALTEEIIFRVIPLEGLALAPLVLAAVSALAFGIPHYFGTPGKLVGVAMAAFLGYVAACSVIETQGVGWAWLMHFVQDVPIIATLLL